MITNEYSFHSFQEMKSEMLFVKLKYLKIKMIFQKNLENSWETRLSLVIKHAFGWASLSASWPPQGPP